MAWLELLSRVLQFLGFVRGAAAVWREHELRVKAKELADAPVTDKEWSDAAKNGDL